MRHSRGFTLIELLMTLVVLGILMSMAIPAFNSMVQSNRTQAVTNELDTAIQLARSEALKRRKTVIICRKNANSDACEDGTDWSGGWLIRQVGGDIVRIWDSSPDSTVSGPTSGITFQSSGLGSGAATFNINVASCKDSKRRVITVAITGNSSLSQTTCTPS